MTSQFVGTLTELENKLLLETARKMKLEDVRNSFRQNVIPDDMEHISSIDLLSRNNKGRPLHSKLAAIIFRLLEAKIPEFKRENSNSIQINYNAPMKKHTDDINIEHSFCFSFGDHSKGELIIYEPLENGGERKIIRKVFKKVLKYEGTYLGTVPKVP